MKWARAFLLKDRQQNSTMAKGIPAWLLAPPRYGDGRIAVSVTLHETGSDRRAAIALVNSTGAPMTLRWTLA